MTNSPTKSDERTALILMSALTFSTGVFDAIGYLGLDKVFTGNMTGNVVILFMGFGGATGIPVIGPLAALFTFMLGAVVAGRTLRNRVAGQEDRGGRQSVRDRREFAQADRDP